MKLRVLIVDDEALARARVRQMLKEEVNVEVLGECSNGPEAIAFMREHRPDLVFLDVNMPEVNGFDVLRALTPQEMPAVIFVTAYDQHAIEAFQVHALDYLLKPFKQARFAEALRHAREHLQRCEIRTLQERLTDLIEGEKTEPAYLTRVAIKSGERTTFVQVGEIDYIESAGNYLVLHAGKQNHVLRETLGNLEGKLSPRLFVRVNRSAMVQVARVKEIQPGLHKDHFVILKEGQRLPLTRGVREIQERLQYC